MTFNIKKHRATTIAEFHSTIKPATIIELAGDTNGLFDQDRLILARKHLEMAFLAVRSCERCDEQTEDLEFTIAALVHDTCLDHMIEGTI